MAATMTQQATPLPHAPHTGAGKIPAPQGAVKMQTWYIDGRGRRQKMPYPVPVDADDHRTRHVRHECTHRRVLNGGSREQCPTAEWLLPGAKRYCPDHGKTPLQPIREGSRLAAVGRDAYRMYGRSAAPLLVPAAALAADAAMSLAQAGPGNALALLPAAGGVYLATRRTLTARAIKRGAIERGARTGRKIRAIERRARVNAAYAGEASGWVAALAATDPSTWPGRFVLVAGVVRWAIGTYRWWESAEERRNRGVDPAEVQVSVADLPPVEVPPDPVQIRAVSTWATLIGGSGGPLSGTELVEWERLPNCEVRANERTLLPNWKAKVVAKVPGSINMRETRPSLLGRIAAAYRCTYADVSFAADESDYSIAYVRVQPDNLLAEVKLWRGPQVANDWKRGVSRVGRFEDGRDIFYRWWTNTGAVHDLISGCSGSGKSELIAQLILNGLHSGGLVLDWLGDPQGGQSYGALKDKVDWFARDLVEIRFMLLGALKEMYRRNDELSAKNIKTWQPSKSMPLLVITLDEVQAYIDDPTILEMAEKLVGQGRKCGIKMRLATQVPAAYNLGGSTYIKEQLKIGQTLIFRAMTDIAGRSAVEGDCPVDPTQLPTVWGKHTCNAGETTAGLMFVQGIHGRDVYGRADFTGDDMNTWLYDTHGESTLNPGSFGRDAQLVSGPLWGDRKARAALALATGRSDQDLLRGGIAVELIDAANVSKPQQAQPAKPDPQQKAETARRRDLVVEAARQAATDGQVTKAKVVEALKDKMSEGSVSNALTEAVADGLLNRVRNGVYSVPGAASAQGALL